MSKAFGKYAIAAALAAGVLGVASGAQARDGLSSDAAAAVGTGLAELAAGALIGDRDDARYHDRDYLPERRYVHVEGYPGLFYYYDTYPNRYFRDHYYQRENTNRWERGYRRIERLYGHAGSEDRGDRRN
jgi:hypothetical protein